MYTHILTIVRVHAHAVLKIVSGLLDKGQQTCANQATKDDWLQAPSNRSSTF